MMKQEQVKFYRPFAHPEEFRVFADEARREGYGLWHGKCSHWMEVMQLCLFV
jgi:hypothetical protein